MILSKRDTHQSLCVIPNISSYAICLLAIMRAVTSSCCSFRHKLCCVRKYWQKKNYLLCHYLEKRSSNSYLQHQIHIHYIHVSLQSMYPRTSDYYHWLNNNQSLHLTAQQRTKHISVGIRVSSGHISLSNGPILKITLLMAP